MPVPFPDKLDRIMEYKMELVSQMSPELMEEMLEGNPDIREFVGEMRQRSFRLFLEFAEKAQRRGDLRRMRPELFMAVLEKTTEIARDARLRDSYASHLDFVRKLNDFVFYGLLPRAGRGD